MLRERLVSFRYGNLGEGSNYAMNYFFSFLLYEVLMEAFYLYMKPIDAIMAFFDPDFGMLYPPSRFKSDLEFFFIVLLALYLAISLFSIFIFVPIASPYIQIAYQSINRHSVKGYQWGIKRLQVYYAYRQHRALKQRIQPLLNYYHIPLGIKALILQYAKPEILAKWEARREV